jgi:chemotaxis protein methyltransferase CheR
MAFTFFFRDCHTLDVAVNLLLPKLDGLREIKIWDVGCAMGPEPYTFAILLAEKMGYFAFKKVRIHATDIDETNTFGKIVNDGIYPENELARIPADIFTKYFTETDEPGKYQIIDIIKNRVIFQKHDLLTLKPIDSGYNLVICKNVLLHLLPDERVKVINMYHDSMADGGLFLTEQTQPMPEANKLKFSQVASDANIYEKLISAA